ncbi:hypothetical protein Nepgr_029293 [Nepenthes gracilis]|uniref:Uncharacterized protein n=1 Tax=Nepenthes gracilis TaxID=150966 RepID=A0AAD3Y4Q5_NEPGR|nr:hypothetical protein Nepgr_029293 [Nepenthes gracilis]
MLYRWDAQCLLVFMTSIDLPNEAEEKPGEGLESELQRMPEVVGQKSKTAYDIWNSINGISTHRRQRDRISTREKLPLLNDRVIVVRRILAAFSDAALLFVWLPFGNLRLSDHTPERVTHKLRPVNHGKFNVAIG